MEGEAVTAITAVEEDTGQRQEAPSSAHDAEDEMKVCSKYVLHIFKIICSNCFHDEEFV